MRTTLVPLEQRDQLRARVERLEEVKRLLDVEQIETDMIHQPSDARDPVVIYWGVVDAWVNAAIRDARDHLRAAETA